MISGYERRVPRPPFPVSGVSRCIHKPNPSPTCSSPTSSVPDVLHPKHHSPRTTTDDGLPPTLKKQLLRRPTVPWFWTESPYSSLTRTRRTFPPNKPIRWNRYPRFTPPLEHHSGEFREGQKGSTLPSCIITWN